MKTCLVSRENPCEKEGCIKDFKEINM
jgi:hypothetical protein